MAKVKRFRRLVGPDSDGNPIYREGGWEVSYADPDGKNRRKKFTKKADADRFATEVEHRKLSGIYVDPTAGRVTFREYAEAWRAAQPHRPGTADQVESRLRLHVYPFIGDRPLASIRPTELQALVKDRAEVMAPGTLDNVTTWMRTIFKAAVHDRLIVESPAVRLKLPAAAPREPVRPLDLDQVAALQAALPARWQAMVPVGVGAGLRSGEALGLTVDRVDFLRKMLTVDQQLVTPRRGMPYLATPKTAASHRVIPLPDYVVEALAEHLAQWPAEGDLGLVFTSERGLPKRRTRFGDMWRAAVEEAGLPEGTRFHDLRHTYASLLIRKGCSVKVVQARLGHATAQETLDTYAHLWPDDDDRTRAAIDDVFRSEVDHKWTRSASDLR